MTQKPTRVLMVAPLFPPEYAGGGKQALALSKKLVQKGVEVIGLGGTSIKKERPVYQREIEGIKIYRVYRSENAGIFENIIYLFRFAIVMFILATRVEIIHFHGIRLYPYLGVPMAKILRKRTIGKISLMETDDPITLSKGLLGKIRMLILRQLDIWIALTTEAKETCLKSNVPPQKIKQITNGVDCQKFQPPSQLERKNLRESLQLPTGIIITFAGIVSYRKGVDVLIEAISNILSKYPEVTFLFIGPNKEEQNPLVDSELTDYLYSFSSDRVIVAGFVDCPRRYIRSADIFVLPSRKEGLSNAFLEALSCGIATVITDHPWLSDVGKKGEDFLAFSSGSVTGLVEKLEVLIEDEKLRNTLSQNASEKARTGFCLHQVASKYHELYTNIQN
ncbi:MAG: hypothetical protein BAJATHORv1_50110 [Candidatus Thorarchaeota archaeon]|nr:MAG: hypothetical protein BAJATHORv1_50110 [Candidatus Thorarchaeota archaeon]